ncbi:hypothetical protein RclHR1_19060001 [Rhizophagus clarus]|uniref:Uncharacterized protein n=1 Tax=Rhizophagus clarus TaxID=94130 RepID=A0A2Z6R418_9GLOM|nr:hypothetical protein RclHR1_19060001 [Rhizophagus clarus]
MAHNTSLELIRSILAQNSLEADQSKTLFCDGSLSLELFRGGPIQNLEADWDFEGLEFKTDQKWNPILRQTRFAAFRMVHRFLEAS